MLVDWLVDVPADVLVPVLAEVLVVVPADVLVPLLADVLVLVPVDDVFAVLIDVLVLVPIVVLLLVTPPPVEVTDPFEAVLVAPLFAVEVVPPEAVDVAPDVPLDVLPDVPTDVAPDVPLDVAPDVLLDDELPLNPVPPEFELVEPVLLVPPAEVLEEKQEPVPLATCARARLPPWPSPPTSVNAVTMGTPTARESSP